MAFTVPADQVVVRGVKSSSIGPIGTKPTSLAIQPTVLQKRFEYFNDDGYMVPGIPFPMGTDNKVSFGWSIMNKGVTGATGLVGTEMYDANVVIALTDDSVMTFSASDMILDGASANIDVLGGSGGVTFYVMGDMLLT